MIAAQVTTSLNTRRLERYLTSFLQPGPVGKDIEGHVPIWGNICKKSPFSVVGLFNQVSLMRRKKGYGIGLGMESGVRMACTVLLGWMRVLGMRVETSVENYSTFAIQQTVITAIGNEDLWDLILVEKIFVGDRNPRQSEIRELGCY